MGSHLRWRSGTEHCVLSIVCMQVVSRPWANQQNLGRVVGTCLEATPSAAQPGAACFVPAAGPCGQPPASPRPSKRRI